MQINVSTLLRDFPKVRQAAARGERVIISTREGNLLLCAEHPPAQSILGGLKGQLRCLKGYDLTAPTTTKSEWIK
jgi:hypothetical protein